MRLFATPPAAGLLLLAVALLALSPAAHAQWKWRDKSGQINASDMPPPKEIPEKDILGRPVPETRRPAPAAASAATPGAPTKGPLDAVIEARKRAAEQEQSAKAKADADKLAEQRAESCRRARGHMAALETGQRIARVNEKGEREILDDRGRAEELRQAREVVASDCR
jgi:hypothetical protein